MGEAPEKPDEDKNVDKESSEENDSSEDEDTDKKSNKSDNKGDDNKGGAPSMLDLTGDELTVTVTDDTVLTKESMRGSGGNPGEAPEKPDGEDSGDAPEKPDVEDSGEAPKKPDGDSNDAESETIELSDIQEGDSDYTVTVDKYEEAADTSGSDSVASWSDYEVEKPDTL